MDCVRYGTQMKGRHGNNGTREKRRKEKQTRRSEITRKCLRLLTK